ncbi:MAG: spore coat U domain-containing protein [Hyphomonadaceae bacterium]|jgi:spore coat protein U-like protein|nr:spore coat U domain-containing protein [Hyphomonadaceae bacterium]
MKPARRTCLIAVVLLLVSASPALAQTCNFSIDNLNFGNIDVTANTAFTTSGTYSASCSGILLSAVRTCPNVGPGTSGGDPSGNPRFLKSGAAQLDYNLFSDAGFSTVWGSRLWAGAAPPTDITLVVLGSGSTSRTMFARIPAGQQAVAPGTYTSSFAGFTAINFQAYLLGLLPPDCATLATPTGTATFTVTATVVPSCTVSATTLDFGSTGLLTANVDSTNTLTVTCSNTIPYTILLDGGLSGATNPTLRKMQKGAETVTYGLFQNPARSQPWGSTSGVNTVSATGSGFAQSHTVYGRVPPQPTPSPGTFLDTITVTVSF